MLQQALEKWEVAERVEEGSCCQEIKEKWFARM